MTSRNNRCSRKPRGFQKQTGARFDYKRVIWLKKKLVTVSRNFSIMWLGSYRQLCRLENLQVNKKNIDRWTQWENRHFDTQMKQLGRLKRIKSWNKIPRKKDIHMAAIVYNQQWSLLGGLTERETMRLSSFSLSLLHIVQAQSFLAYEFFLHGEFVWGLTLGREVN